MEVWKIIEGLGRIWIGVWGNLWDGFRFGAKVLEIYFLVKIIRFCGFGLGLDFEFSVF